jgi:hypothetical protein
MGVGESFDRNNKQQIFQKTGKTTATTAIKIIYF